jgi:large subunit ribosomal protein L7/L12
VEGAPSTIKKGATKSEAEALKKKLEGIGAKVEIKQSTPQIRAQRK